MPNTSYLLKKYKKNHPICEKCGATTDIEVHHITPRILGGTDNENNFIALCHKCHREQHAYNHSELTKIGIAKAKEAPITDVYISKIDLLQQIQDEELVSAKEIVDAIINAPIKKYIS